VQNRNAKYYDFSGELLSLDMITSIIKSSTEAVEGQAPFRFGNDLVAYTEQEGEKFVI
jgi:hypothetical protein